MRFKGSDGGLVLKPERRKKGKERLHSFTQIVTALAGFGWSGIKVGGGWRKLPETEKDCTHGLEMKGDSGAKRRDNQFNG